MNNKIICPVCNGKGKENFNHIEASNGEMTIDEVVCGFCDGVGFIIDQIEKCMSQSDFEVFIEEI